MASPEEAAPATISDEAAAPDAGAATAVAPRAGEETDAITTAGGGAAASSAAESASAPTAAAATAEASPAVAPSKPPNRTAEIWSARLHREILALTGEGGDDAETVGVLPPFIALEDHTIDIAKGLCDVTFRIDVEPPSVVPGADDGRPSAGGGTTEEAEASENREGETNDDIAEEGKRKGGDEAADEKPKEIAESEAGSSKKEEAGGKSEAASKADNVPDQGPPHVIIMLDASTGTSPDGSPGPAATPSSYPFQSPTAMLISGAHLFPRPGSEISDGDYIEIELDWTPSLHLNDAILHVALKVRESIRRGEPFYSNDGANDDAAGGAVGGNLEAEVLKAKEKVTSFFSIMAAVASEVVAPNNVAAAAGGGVTAAAAVVGAGEKENIAKADKKKAKRAIGSDTVAIGDEIDLSQSPWNVCAGMYSCKAIRRPVFVELAMSQAEAEAKAEEKRSGTGKAFFNSFRNSAKSVLEESFLMISEQYIIEIKTNKFSIGTGKVVLVTLIASLAKLKFRREESISLFLKEAPDDPLIYMMSESADCVKQIQTILKAHGVKGKHTNAAMQRSIQTALSIVTDIQNKERALEHDPTIENVNEIMDLCRQAAERFEQAGDSRHQEVMAHMKKFLSNPITASILNGSYESKKKSEGEATPSKPAVPEGEVLSSPEWMLNEDDDDDADVDKNEKKDSDMKDDALEKTDDVLKKAKKDMEALGASGASALADILNTDISGAGSDEVGDDSLAELDAMFASADAELNDLMKE